MKVCRGCGGRIELVDISEGPFGSPQPTWWHLDRVRNYSHQARPA